MKTKQKRLTRKEKKAKNEKEGIKPIVPRLPHSPETKEFMINLFSIRPDEPRIDPTVTTSMVREDGITIFFPPLSEMEGYDVWELREFYRYAFIKDSCYTDRTICFLHLMEYCASYDNQSFKELFANAPNFIVHFADKYFPGRMESLVIALQMRTGTVIFNEEKLNEMTVGAAYHNHVRENLAAYLISNLKIAMGSPRITYEHQHYYDDPNSMVDLWGNLRIEQWEKFCPPVFRFPGQRRNVARFHGHDKDRPFIIWKVHQELDRIHEKYLERIGKIEQLERVKRSLEQLLWIAEGKLRIKEDRLNSIIKDIS